MASPSSNGFKNLVQLDEVAARMGVSRKTVRKYHRDFGLPLFRFANHGPYFALWTRVEAWAERYSDSLGVGTDGASPPS